MIDLRLKHEMATAPTSKHIEKLIVDELRKPCLMTALRELRDAPAMDLRLRNELVRVIEADERAIAAIEQAEKAGC